MTTPNKNNDIRRYYFLIITNLIYISNMSTFYSTQIKVNPIVNPEEEKTPYSRKYSIVIHY